MEPRHFLRAEGIAALIAALATYVALDGPLPLLVVLALAPDGRPPTADGSPARFRSNGPSPSFK